MMSLIEPRAVCEMSEQDAGSLGQHSVVVLSVVTIQRVAVTAVSIMYTYTSLLCKVIFFLI